MTTRMNWLYLVAVSMVLALVPGRALAQTTCVDSNTPTGIALADLNEHLDRIGSRLDTLDTIFSGPMNLLSILEAQGTNSQLTVETNNLTIALPEINNALALTLPTIPVATSEVVASLTALTQSILATIANLRAGLPSIPGLPLPLPTAHPTRVAIADRIADLQATRSTIPPFCE